MNSNSNSHLWNKLLKSRYRDAFIAASVGVHIASQLHALRTSRGKSQEKLAEEIGMNQSTISQMEKPDYRAYSLSSLIRFAQYYKVGLEVRFVALTDQLKRMLEQTAESLAPPPFGEPLTAPRAPKIPHVQTTTPNQNGDLPLTELKLAPKPPKRKTEQDDRNGNLTELQKNLWDETQSAEA